MVVGDDSDADDDDDGDYGDDDIVDVVRAILERLRCARGPRPWWPGGARSGERESIDRPSLWEDVDDADVMIMMP